MMDGNIRFLLNAMHPICMSDTLVAKATAEYAPDMSQDDFKIFYSSLCADSKKEVVIFKSAILEYIYICSLRRGRERLYPPRSDADLRMQAV